MDPVVKRFENQTWVTFADYLKLRNEFEHVREDYIRLDVERNGLFNQLRDAQQTIKEMEHGFSAAKGPSGHPVRDEPINSGPPHTGVLSEVQ